MDANDKKVGDNLPGIPADKQLEESSPEYRKKYFTRREFIRVGGVVIGGSLLAGVPRISFGSEAKPKKGGVLKTAARSEAARLDQHRWIGHIYTQLLMHDGLVLLDDNLNPVPSLALKWDISPDHKKYVFYLKEKVKFHNGREVTAEDVKANIEKVRDPQKGALVATRMAAVESVTAKDRYTVMVELKQPFAPFLQTLHPNYCAIMAPESFEKADTEPVGCGPFKLAEWKRDNYLKMIRHDDYHLEGLPYIDEIITRAIIDPSIAITALRTREVDFVDVMPHRQMADMRKNPPKGLKFIQNPLPNGTRHITFNCRIPPFNDKKVREAVCYAIDAEELFQASVWGVGEQANQLVWSKTTKWHNPNIKPREKNPDKAKKLLEEAGHGKGLTVQAIASASYPGIFLQPVQIVQANLRDIGITVEVETLDWATYYRKWLTTHEYQLITPSFATVADPDDWYWGQFHSSADSSSYSGFHTPELDKLLEEGRAIVDEKRRIEIYQRIAQILHDEAIAVPHTIPLHINGMWENINGYSGDSVGNMYWQGGKGLPRTWIA